MDHVRKYVQSGHRTVHGWLTATAGEAVVKLAGVQEQRGIRGGAAEIGVHEGRLFILLALLLRRDERALAVDLFDLQGENEDGSGYGSRERLIANLHRHGARREGIEVLRENSMRLTAERVRELIGAPRIFSVDGGHTAEITYNDLGIAADSLCDGGLVILDDFMSARWPGVTEGACRFMLERSGIAPIAFVSNKLILCRGDSAHYRTVIEGETIEMFGATCVLTRDSLGWKERLARTDVWRRIRGNAFGRALRRLLADA